MEDQIFKIENLKQYVSSMIMQYSQPAKEIERYIKENFGIFENFQNFLKGHHYNGKDFNNQMNQQQQQFPRESWEKFKSSIPYNQTFPIKLEIKQMPQTQDFNQTIRDIETIKYIKQELKQNYNKIIELSKSPQQMIKAERQKDISQLIMQGLLKLNQNILKLELDEEDVLTIFTQNKSSEQFTIQLVYQILSNQFNNNTKEEQVYQQNFYVQSNLQNSNYQNQQQNQQKYQQEQSINAEQDEQDNDLLTLQQICHILSSKSDFNFFISFTSNQNSKADIQNHLNLFQLEKLFHEIRDLFKKQILDKKVNAAYFNQIKDMNFKEEFFQKQTKENKIKILQCYLQNCLQIDELHQKIVKFRYQVNLLLQSDNSKFTQIYFQQQMFKFYQNKQNLPKDILQDILQKLNENFPYKLRANLYSLENFKDFQNIQQQNQAKKKLNSEEAVYVQNGNALIYKDFNSKFHYIAYIQDAENEDLKNFKDRKGFKYHSKVVYNLQETPQQMFSLVSNQNLGNCGQNIQYIVNEIRALLLTNLLIIHFSATKDQKNSNPFSLSKVMLNVQDQETFIERLKLCE